MVAKNLICLSIFLMIVIAKSNAQVDSSNIYSKIISGGKVKKWHSRLAFISNSRQVHSPTLTFACKPKTGSINKYKGRDMVGSFRNFSNWKIQKESNNYILMISPQEKYFLSIIISLDTKNLILKSFANNRKTSLSLSGDFVEMQ